MTSRAEAKAEARDALRRAGALPDDAIDLGEAALALGVLDHPTGALARYRRHLDGLAEDVAARADPDDDALATRIATLHRVIVARYGYVGDDETYDDLQNANLLRVIDRRKGLPVALGVLWMHAARAMGWAMTGLNFPGHFLVRMEAGGERAILDPFHEGTTRDAAELRGLLKAAAGDAAELSPDHYRPVGNRDVLLRLHNNVKLRHLSAQDVPRALETLEAMRLFAPDEPSLWRETGLLEAHQGNLDRAIHALETFLALGDGDRHMHQAAILIQQLKNRTY